jgi:hypothetical protein
MLRLDRVIRPWKESGALNSQITLYGFWNEQAFLTKSGDLGIVLRLRGVDYESLDQAAQEYAVKRLEAGLKTFGVPNGPRLFLVGLYKPFKRMAGTTGLGTSPRVAGTQVTDFPIRRTR